MYLLSLTQNRGLGEETAFSMLSEQALGAWPELSVPGPQDLRFRVGSVLTEPGSERVALGCVVFSVGGTGRCGQAPAPPYSWVLVLKLCVIVTLRIPDCFLKLM